MSSTLTMMESFSQLERATGRSRLPRHRGLYSALHNYVKDSCATHKRGSVKYQAFAENPGVLRNGSLMFWKLAPPNLIPGRVRLPTDSLKAVCEQHLSYNRTLICQPRQPFCPRSQSRAGTT